MKHLFLFLLITKLKKDDLYLHSTKGKREAIINVASGSKAFYIIDRLCRLFDYGVICLGGSNYKIFFDSYYRDTF